MLYSPLSWDSSDQLEQRLLSQKVINIYGHHSPLALAATLSDICCQDQNSQIVLVPSTKEAIQLKDSLFFFDPEIQCEVLKNTDVSPYSGLQPPPRTSPERIHWFYKAQKNQKKSVLIAPLAAFLQKTIPEKALKNSMIPLSVGEEFLHPSIKLKERGYIATANVEDIGQFSIKGGILDIYSPSYKNPVRIELFGDEIESLRFLA